ncbi:MAG: rhomboid family intramembrane serine protease [Bacteroides sp.]|nr:rhomboid family intramembrane serine protease [Bacteroides sp.]
MSNRFTNFVEAIPPVTRNLIIINLLVWLAEALFPRFGSLIVDHLGLHYVGASHFNPVQIITYLFVHDPGSPWHVLFNMFTLWMFGSILERIWGSKRYFLFYFVCGVGAAFIQEIVWAFTWMGDYVDVIARMNGLTSDTVRTIIDNGLDHGDPETLSGVARFKNMLVTIGASGAVFGIILGFAMLFPDRPMYLMFIPYPIKAKYMMIGYGILEFFLGVAEVGMVAHFAHLGGMLFGLIIILYWKKKGTFTGGRFY